jgi:hypothetical protein
MAKKTSSNSLRLATNKVWASAWFAKSTWLYSRLLSDDFLMRKYLNDTFIRLRLLIHYCYIKRAVQDLTIVVFMYDISKQKRKKLSTRFFKQLQRSLRHTLHLTKYQKRIQFIIRRDTSLFTSAQLLAKYIKYRLQAHIPYFLVIRELKMYIQLSLKVKTILTKLVQGEQPARGGSVVARLHAAPAPLPREGGRPDRDRFPAPVSNVKA